MRHHGIRALWVIPDVGDEVLVTFKAGQLDSPEPLEAGDRDLTGQLALCRGQLYDHTPPLGPA
jgi:hypothetical protein